VRKEASCRDPQMTAYCLEVRKLEDKFEGLDIHHVLWKDNEAADALARIALARDPIPSGGVRHRPAQVVCPAEQGHGVPFDGSRAIEPRGHAGRARLALPLH
jgi:hypothetical protein